MKQCFKQGDQWITPFKELTKGVDSFHSSPHSLCHLFLSPQAEKLHFKTQLLSHSGASPLHVTHNSNSLWSLAALHLPQRAPHGPLPTACSLSEGQGRKRLCGRRFIGSGGPVVQRSRFGNLAPSMGLCHMVFQAKTELVVSDLANLVL